MSQNTGSVGKRTIASGAVIGAANIYGSTFFPLIRPGHFYLTFPLQKLGVARSIKRMTAPTSDGAIRSTLFSRVSPFCFGSRRSHTISIRMHNAKGSGQRLMRMNGGLKSCRQRNLGIEVLLTDILHKHISNNEKGVRTPCTIQNISDSPIPPGIL